MSGDPKRTAPLGWVREETVCRCGGFCPDCVRVVYEEREHTTVNGRGEIARLRERAKKGKR